jgi:hypothetical protein
MDDDDLRCPICGSPVRPLPRTGDAEGFDCPKHGGFKVADTVLAVRNSYSASDFQRALARVKAQARAGELPTITTYDF